jgi:hypothetical protein
MTAASGAPASKRVAEIPHPALIGDVTDDDVLRRAGIMRATVRVVNPQRIGGQRIAAAALQLSVVEFLDVVMHDGSLEFRLEEVTVRANSPAGRAHPPGRERERDDRRACAGAPRP